MRWEAVELSSENRATLFIPQGMAHGFQTLADDTEVSYQISEHYVPASARAVRWNDPAFNILWPLPVSIMSSRDRASLVPPVKRVLLTGSSGFIGRCTPALLAPLGYEIHAVGRHGRPGRRQAFTTWLTC